MTDQPPHEDLDTAPDWNDDESKPQGDAPDDGMRQMPTDPPAVVPAISSEQFGIAAGVGLAGFAKQNPEGGFVGDEDDPWQKPEPGTETETDMDDVAP
jgi:hypothetical protein